LRDLQARKYLEPLLTALLAERGGVQSGRERALPLLLKVSPDLSDSELRDIAGLLKSLPLDGVVATNTTLSRQGVSEASVPAVGSQTGGLSGVPLRPLALRTVAALRAQLGPAFPIIGVGGIDSTESARAMRAAGADLIQLYTGLIYKGPALIRRLVQAM
jgi:dihydroorotate dehydrogenase